MTEPAAEPALEGWIIAQAACEATAWIDLAREGTFALSADGRLRPVTSSDREAVVCWRPSQGWCSLLPPEDPRQTLLDLYLPVSSATAARPIIVGHLGQSLDGFIATPSGDSCFVTGPQNILHLHRLRALCHAVIVGARTVENDNPRLTTRLVSGNNPVRVILDPKNRLSRSHRVFCDGDANTLRVIGRREPDSASGPEPQDGVLEVGYAGGTLDLHELVRQLRARGCARLFVEGGGVTVSSFLEAGLLDRLHVAIAPLLIGDGRPGIRLTPHARLKDCLKVQPRIYRAGDDVLFDCDLRANAPAEREAAQPANVARLP